MTSRRNDDSDGLLPSALGSSILVVDDVAENRLVMQAALAPLGETILEADGGASALRILLERDVAVVLLDVQMPDIDGYQTAQLIRARPRSRAVPIIFVTAYDRNDSEVRAAYHLGAVDFLFKPFEPEMLRAKVSVFVELNRRAKEMRRQAEQLQEVERRQHRQELLAERQRLEAELHRREALEQARVNARLQEQDRRKNEFLAVLGHELRNPLAAIVGGLALLERRSARTDSIRRTHQAMARQTRHLVRLVDDLLDVSRITSGSIKLVRHPVAVAEVIQEALVLVDPQAQERGLELEIDLPPTPIQIDVDPVRMKQVICNLLINAIRYSDPPGRISLRCAVERDGNSDQQRCVITVTDTGIGMTPELLERVFEPFTQARPGSGGLGIGLTISRRLVEHHGGTLTAASDGLGRGSTFEVRLPVAGAATASAAPPVVEPRPVVPVQPPAALHVVLIEDSDDVREVMHELIEEWGHTVDAAATGRQGVELILRTRPQVAIVDIGLPDMDGYAVAERIRQTLPPSELRLVAMTGFGQARDRRRALDSGFDEHLAKPPGIDALQQILARPDPAPPPT